MLEKYSKLQIFIMLLFLFYTFFLCIFALTFVRHLKLFLKMKILDYNDFHSASIICTDSGLINLIKKINDKVSNPSDLNELNPSVKSKSKKTSPISRFRRSARRTNSITGDINTSSKISNYVVKFYNNSVIFIVGSIGFGTKTNEYYNSMIKILDEICSKNNIKVLFIRGNNDKTSFFTSDIINTDNVKAIPDYTIVKLSNKNFLCVGGNLSFNREWKKSSASAQYIEDEMPIFNQGFFNELKNNKDESIDWVISNVSPSFSFPDKFDGLTNWFEKDKELQDDIESSRTVMDEIYTSLKKMKKKPVKWVYGGYDSHNEDFRANIEFVSLSLSNDELTVIDEDSLKTDKLKSSLEDMFFSNRFKSDTTFDFYNNDVEVANFNEEEMAHDPF